MAKTIDKEAKRREIAVAAMGVFIRHGLLNAKVDDVAKAAGVAKGTIYLYFKTKEEIVVEIWRHVLEEHAAHIKEGVEQGKSAADKLRAFHNFEFVDAQGKEDLLTLMCEYMASCLLRADEEILALNKETQTQMLAKVEKIIADGVEKGEFRPCNPRVMAEGIETAFKGHAVQSRIMPWYDAEKATQEFVEEIISLLHIEKESL